jgi:glucokinase
LDSRRGVILGPPNLPGWDEVYITARYEKALGIPTYVQNDANACALAEWKWGAGRGCRHMIFLTFGTGLGAGLILDGKLYLGANELSGEVGHIRLADDGPVGYGKAGSFEGFCSGAGIATAARRVITKYRQKGKTVGFFDNDRDIRDISARLIAEAMHDGDPVAREIYETTARYLGRGLAMLIDTFTRAKDLGVGEEPLQQARKEHDRAHLLWEWWTAENSDGFHNPDLARESLAESMNASQRGIEILTKAIGQKTAK